MKLEFFGGAQTVTGSQHLLTVNGHRLLFECGLYQGRRADSFRRNRHLPYDPSSVDVTLLSHAHIDHSGNIPNLVRNGFRGPIYATKATVDLCQIMLRDSAFLQEKDVEFVNKLHRRRGESPVTPLYTIEEAEAAMTQFVGIDYNQPVEVVPGVRATYRDAGHILGSAGILLEIEQANGTTRLGFSGDIGRVETPILRDPDYLRDLEVLIMESTYGNRLHRVSEDVEEELAETIRQVAGAGGKIVIPAFAVGRTQLLVYLLHKLFDQNRIPDIPIFVDSPLASEATEVFRRHPECFDRETYRVFVSNNMDPFGFSRLHYIRDVEDSKRLNDLNVPHIVISASGMAEGGRILHHLRNSIGNPRNMVLLVGFAAQETLARKLKDGNQTVRIFGEEHRVHCRVKSMEDFSAHGDRRSLLDYVRTQGRTRLKQVFLVHGEPDQAEPLQQALLNEGYRSVHFPALGDRFSL